MMSRLTLAWMITCLPNIAQAELEATYLRYTCERAVQIPVVYAKSGDDAIAVLTVEGGQLLLYAQPTTSGARYGWPSDGSNYVWLTEGAGAKLLWRDGATKAETTLLAACTQN